MKRVFLSFQMEDKKQVDGIRLMAWNDHVDLEFFDESVRRPYNSEHAAYIKSKIRPKINRSSVAVCFLGSTTYQSEWVDWELRTALELEKRIILMGLPRGPRELRLPAAVAGESWWLWDPAMLSTLIEGSR